MSSINTPCRKAMNNLEVLLRSYNNNNNNNDESGSDQVESLFDNAFDRTVRLDLNGQSYKRDFLLYQQTQNFSRRRKVEEISMEVLDNESFRYTFRIEDDCSDSISELNFNESERDFSISSSSSISSTFHSLATVKDGKIVKIKPMTGLAYTGLFVSNIHYANNNEAEEEQDGSKKTQKQGTNTKSIRKSSRSFVRRIVRGVAARRREIPRRVSE